jgi:hypothetical protein
MESNEPKPQLARKYYNVDSSSDDDDDGDLQILSPIREKTKMPNKNLDSDYNDTGDDNTKISTKKKAPPIATTSMAKQLSKNKNYSTAAAAAAAATSRSTNLSSDSDTDDDDDRLLMNSKRVFEKREDPKKKRKRERDEQKEKEKQERIKKRKEAKEEKEHRKQEESMTKKQHQDYHHQTTGKYAHEEIAVLLDKDLYDDDPHGLVEKLKTDFLVHSYSSSLGSPAKAIQFVRKDKLMGGAKDAIANLESSNRIRNKKSTATTKKIGGDSDCDGCDDCGYEQIHYLVLIFEPDDFIPLLSRHSQDEEDDYPALESYLDSIRSRWKQVWNIPLSSGVEPKIIFLLRDLPKALDKKWVEYRRHKGSNNERSLPTVKELEDAMQWLLVQFQVECILCPSIELLQLTIHKMTRSLAEKRYTNQVTELECIKKIKQGCTASDNVLEKAKDVWIRQLQQLPGMSENRAQHAVTHYPTCQSLWQAYQREHHQQQQQGNDNDNEANSSSSALLDDKLSGDNRLYSKLSDSVYRVMTSNDPNEMIL